MPDSAADVAVADPPADAKPAGRPDVPPPPVADTAPDPTAIAKERDDARRELGTLKRELEKLQRAEQERADLEKTELQKAQEQASEWERKHGELTQQHRDTQLRALAQSEAHRLGYLRPDRAWREIEMADVELDEKGEPKNIRQLLEDELKARPELKATTTRPDAGAGDRGPTGGLTLEQIRGMSPEQINAAWDRGEVQAALGKAGR